MITKRDNLIWIDLEMTGLNTDTDRIIEIATIVTDSKLNILDKGPSLAIHQKDELLEGMDDWNKRTHKGTGLIEKVKASLVTEAEAEAATLEFLKKYVSAKKSPMCGNSVCQDRRFLYRSMPTLEDYFHYRNLDVSTVKELAVRWAPEIVSGFKKDSRHSALSDICDSVEELRYYRDTFFKVSIGFN